MELSTIWANEYIRSAIYFVVAYIVLKLVIHTLTVIAVRLTSKTKTDLDDMIIERARHPATHLSLIIALRIAILQLTLPNPVATAAFKIIETMFALIIAYIIFAAADIIILRMLNKVSKKGGFAVVKNLQSAIYSALKIVLILIAFAYILSVWGVNITPFLTGLGIAGLAVALALQPVLANVFSGVAVVLDKTIQVGDVIFLDSVKGTIYKIGLRSTQVKTFDNEIFVVPNTKIADGIVQNIALPNEEARGSVPFGVAYGTDITKVQKIVLKEIKKIEHVLTEPAPAVRFMNMGDSALDFKAFFYVDSYKNRFVASEKIRTAIYNSLNKAKIEIPFPQVDVHMKKK